MPVIFSFMVEIILVRNWSVSAFKHMQHFFQESVAYIGVSSRLNGARGFRVYLYISD